MRTNRLTSTRRAAAAAVAIGSASLLLVGVLQAPAGAVAPPYNTTTSVVGSPASPLTGQTVTYTAKTSAPGHGTPGGTLTFSLVGADSSVANCDAGNVVVFTGGTATCTVTGGLAAGSGPYTVTASYTDTADSTYNPSSATRSVTVKQDKSTTTVTSSANPSVTGEAVDFTAQVAAATPGSGSPTGTVTFSGVTCDGGTNVIPVAVGLAQCMIAGGLTPQSALLIVSGTYSGDTGFLTSTGTVKQVAAQAAATVAVAVTPNSCVGDICTVGQGTPIAFAGTASATTLDGGSGVPTGSLAFSIITAGTKAAIACDGGSNTIPLVSGQATCSIAAGLPASVYFTVKVTLVSPGYAAPTATIYENSALAGTTTALSTLRNVGAGQSFNVVATVSTTGTTSTVAPTGYVNFLVCGNNSNGNNGCQGGVAPVGAGGVAQFLVGGGEYPGLYVLSAIYTGDSNYFSSASKNKDVVIGKSPTQLTFIQPGGFVTITGQAATLTATVIAPNGAAGSVLIGPMTGTITFAITDPSGNPVNCAGGNADTLSIDPGEVEGTATCYLPPGSLTTTSPSGVTYSLHATYSGDSDYVSSNANSPEFVVPAIS